MNKKLSFILLLLLTINLFSAAAHAETVYVTDDIQFTLRNSESNRSKILKMLRTGTPLTLVEENTETGYSRVRTNSGVEGYILNRHISKTPIHKYFLEKANVKLQELQTENDLMKEELKQLKGKNADTITTNSALEQERDQLSAELNELKQTAANAVQLKHQRDQLQERVISVERELQQLKRENQALEDSSNQDWFLYGGILSLFGVILGFILPKLSWRQKTTKWDTF